MSPRDSQKHRVYAAEGDVPAIRYHHRFETLEQADEWLHKTVMGSEWFQQKWPKVKHVTLVLGRASSSAFARFSTISLPKWAWSKGILLHELAHICGERDHASHGMEFCNNFLALVGHFISPALRTNLAEAMLARKVRLHPKRKASNPVGNPGALAKWRAMNPVKPEELKPGRQIYCVLGIDLLWRFTHKRAKARKFAAKGGMLFCRTRGGNLWYWQHLYPRFYGWRPVIASENPDAPCNALGLTFSRNLDRVPKGVTEAALSMPAVPYTIRESVM